MFKGTYVDKMGVLNLRDQGLWIMEERKKSMAQVLGCKMYADIDMDKVRYLGI